MLLNAIIKESSPGFPNTSIYFISCLFIIVPRLMRILLNCLIFKKSRFLIFRLSSAVIGEHLLFTFLFFIGACLFTTSRNKDFQTSHISRSLNLAPTSPFACHASMTFLNIPSQRFFGVCFFFFCGSQK